MKLKQIYSKVERSKQRTIHSRSDSLQPDQPEIWHQIFLSSLQYSLWNGFLLSETPNWLFPCPFEPPNWTAFD